MVAGVVIVGVLVYLYLTYFHLSGVYVVRYSRPDCPFCVSSKADWEALKADFNGMPAEKKANLLATVKFVDVDLSNSSSLDTYMWKYKHSPAAVPNIIALYKGSKDEFAGPDNSAKSIEKFIEGVFVKNNLIKK